MSSTDYHLADSADMLRYADLRQAAIDHVLAESALAFPELIARLSPAGKAACAEDIGYHLEFLSATLESGDLSPFLAYLGWINQVLQSRGIPLQSLSHSLLCLADFFRKAMGERSAPVVAALLAGHAALQANLPAPAYDQPCPEPWQEAAAFQEALLRGDRHAASALFEATLARGHALSQVEVHVIQPALYGVGRAWQANKVSVAQEHVATALAQTLMSQGAGRAELPQGNGWRALLACPAGNHHTVGLRMVADALEADGWSVQYLGADTPLPALIGHVAQERPHLVALSASLPQQLRSLRATVDGLRQTLGDECPKIAVGGLVFNQFPLLARSLRATVLGADACSATAAARQLVEGT